MCPIVLLEKDPFVDAEASASENAFESNVNVRRPVYGMTVKEARFAYMSVYQDTAAATEGIVPISLVDSSAPGGFSESNHNFILQSVQETRQERVQIVETFGDHFAFFYGEKPIVLQVSGILFNTADFNWNNEWLRNYDEFLRGTKCVEHRARVFLGWDDVLAQGYILSSSIVYSAEQPNVCPFSFQMLLSKPPLDMSIVKQESSYDASGYRLSTTTESDYVGGGRSRSRVSVMGSLVNGAEDARALDSGMLVEYLSPLHDFGKRGIDPATGESIVESVGEGRLKSQLIFGRKQWKDMSEALIALNTQLTAQQTGADLMTSRLALKANPGSFQMASRDSVMEAISGSLSSGVVNAAAVVPSAPVLDLD